MTSTTSPAGAPPLSLRWAGLAQFLTIAGIAWGAFAFGAVYPWAYWSLAITCLLAGVAGLLVDRRTSAGVSRAMILAVSLLGIAILIQVVPLSASILDAVTPSTTPVIRQIHPLFAAGLTASHPISLRPSLTWTGFGLFVSFAMLLIGTARLTSICGARPIVGALTVIAVVLALAGIIQRPLFTGKIYGLWTTQMVGSPFGPFVNKNHFAGWMLMGIPLSLGLLCAAIARAMAGVKPSWRERLLWFSSPNANQLVLIAAGVAIMTLSLVLTMSRSGMAAVALALIITAWFVARGRTSAGRKLTAVGYLIVLAVAVVLWVGADMIVTRFGQANWGEFNNRRGAWTDAWRIASMFPMVGTGLNTYGTATLFFQEHDLTHHYAQAHNDYLQLAAEGGILLGLPAVLCLTLLVRDIRRRFRDDRGSTAYWLRAGAVAALLAIAIQETVEFSLQMPGNAALFAVVCGIALHTSPERRRGGGSQAAGSTSLSWTAARNAGQGSHDSRF